MIKAGDLVTIRPNTQPPKLYGLGTVVKVLEINEITKLPVRVAVLWSAQSRVGNCGVYALEMVSEGR